MAGRRGRVRASLLSHLEGGVLSLGDLELADVLDALVVLDGPAAVGAFARHRLPEGLVQLASAHLVCKWADEDRRCEAQGCGCGARRMHQGARALCRSQV